MKRSYGDEKYTLPLPRFSRIKKTPPKRLKSIGSNIVSLRSTSTHDEQLFDEVDRVKSKKEFKIKVHDLANYANTKDYSDNEDL